MVVILSSCAIPTSYGKVTLRVYGEQGDHHRSHTWVACLWGNVADSPTPVHVRVHDACMTSEVLGSLKCDCAQQLRLAQRYLARRGGLLIYTPQEGRGIGLAQKIAAYALQEEQGLDTVDANIALGLPDEARDYRAVRDILEDLRVQSIMLLTNNPFKVSKLRDLGVRVKGTRTVLAPSCSDRCQSYLRTKADRMGHAIPTDHHNAPLICQEADDDEDPSWTPSQLGPSSFLSSGVPAGSAGSMAARPMAAGPMAAGSMAAGPMAAGSMAAGPSFLSSAGAPEQRSVTADACAALLASLSYDVAAHCRHVDGEESMPFVTLTYAQALDGSIAGPLGASGPRLMLSGK